MILIWVEDEERIPPRLLDDHPMRRLYRADNGLLLAGEGAEGGEGDAPGGGVEAQAGAEDAFERAGAGSVDVAGPTDLSKVAGEVIETPAMVECEHLCAGDAAIVCTFLCDVFHGVLQIVTMQPCDNEAALYPAWVLEYCNALAAKFLDAPSVRQELLLSAWVHRDKPRPLLNCIIRRRWIYLVRKEAGVKGNKARFVSLEEWMLPTTPPTEPEEPPPPLHPRCPFPEIATRLVEGATQSEIAAELGCTRQAVFHKVRQIAYWLEHGRTLHQASRGYWPPERWVKLGLTPPSVDRGKQVRAVARKRRRAAR